MDHNLSPASLLTERDASVLLKIPMATLRRWRWAGAGPRFLKLGGHVRYRRGDIEEFIAAGERGGATEARG